MDRTWKEQNLYREMSGAAPGAGGGVEMTEVDGGINGSGGIEENKGI